MDLKTTTHCDKLSAENLVVTFNVGSATLKMGVYELSAHTKVEGALCFCVNMDLKHRTARWQGLVPDVFSDFSVSCAQTSALNFLELIAKQYADKQFIFVHRVVHGGQYVKPVKISKQVLKRLHDLSHLAPLHQPPALAIIDAIYADYQAHDFVQIAAFDTAFHAQRERLWYEYALPESLRDDGVRSYGFHGLSYQSIMRTLQKERSDMLDKRLIIAHLGSGCSITSVVNQQSVDSTLGFSGLDGIPMGTRPGHLDPGVLLYLMEKGWSHQEITQCLYKESGLLGLSGISSDVRELHLSNNKSAAFALAYFAAHVAKAIAALIPSLQGLDAIVFTGGIGEHDAKIREQIFEYLQWYQVIIDKHKNQTVNLQQRVCDISATDSQVRLFVIQTDEQFELFISALNV